ncbi:single-stranded DNA-binding protein [Acinetobacter sp. UBA3106]|uniref:single-stranded DNA-binding protein n=1 Tax=Acinetobacter sp. UBA3106 TaxID=1945936 RepID=UPI0032E3D071
MNIGKTRTLDERKQATEWHRIATSNRLVEIASKYLKKGGKVYIEGALRTRKWKDDSIFRKGNNQDKSRCAAIVLSE